MIGREEKYGTGREYSRFKNSAREILYYRRELSLGGEHCGG